MTWLLWLSLFLCLLAAAVGLPAYGAKRWAATTRTLSWSNYQTRDGMTVPFTGEVAWVRPEGRKPYFLGTVTSLTYEFASSLPWNTAKTGTPHRKFNESNQP